MNAALGALLIAVAWGPSPAAIAQERAAAPPAAADLAGTWAGTLSHEGETTPFALELEPGDDGKILIRLSIPVVHVARSPIGRVALDVQGSELRLGPFTFAWDATAGTLSGTLPAGLAPVYAIPVTLRRVERLDLPARPELSAPTAQPVWTFDAGAPLWPGATYAAGVVYAGGDDGRLHALDVRTGKERWSFRAGGAIRTRASVAGKDLFLQADDGYLYKLGADDGKQRWRVRIVLQPIIRLPFDNPKSRQDRFGSDVTVAGGRLYLGTHDGRLLCLKPGNGARIWEFRAGESVLAAPTVDSGRVFFGSYDGHVYAVDALKGELLWKRDTRGAVVSTPAVSGTRVVIGSRSYDLLGLDAGSGEVLWKRYFWFSWVESSAVIRGGVAYVGSSDAAGLFAYDVANGQRLWAADAYGWPWGQPTVTDQRVFVGTASIKGYLAGHRGGILAVDRESGRAAWSYQAIAADSGPYGFPGSPATGSGLVFFTGLDGRVYAFAQ